MRSVLAVLFGVALCLATNASAQPLPQPARRLPTPILRPAAPSQTPTNVIAVPELSFVGGAMVDLSDRAAPAVTIAVPELYFVGGTPVDLSDRSAAAVRITTPELSFVGQ